MWDLVGNEAEVGFLRASITARRWSHAYLIEGPEFVGKYALASTLAKALNCLNKDKPCDVCSQCVRIQAGKHVDVMVVDVQKDAHSSDENSNQLAILRDIARSLALTPVEGAFRVVILDNADRISYEAQNSCLKLLEEPPPNVVLMLLATNSHNILNTIKSRCQSVSLAPIPFESMMNYLVDTKQLSHEAATVIARASNGLVRLADSLISNENWQDEVDNSFEEFVQLSRASIPERLQMVTHLEKEIGKSRDDVVSRLKLWLGWYREILMGAYGFTEGGAYLKLKDMTALPDAWANPETAIRCINLVNTTINNIRMNANVRLSLERLVIML